MQNESSQKGFEKDLTVVETTENSGCISEAGKTASTGNVAQNGLESTALPVDVMWNRKWDEKNLAELQQKRAEEETAHNAAKKKVECIMQMLRDSEAQVIMV